MNKHAHLKNWPWRIDLLASPSGLHAVQTLLNIWAPPCRRMCVCRVWHWTAVSTFVVDSGLFLCAHWTSADPQTRCVTSQTAWKPILRTWSLQCTKTEKWFVSGWRNTEKYLHIHHQSGYMPDAHYTNRMPEHVWMGSLEIKLLEIYKRGV